MTLLVGALLALLALSSTVGAGLELEISRLRGEELRKPMLAALLANLVVIPGASLLLLPSMGLPPSAFVGLTLVALSPGGASSPLLARLAGGDPTRVGALYVALCAGCVLTLGLGMRVVLPARDGGLRVVVIATLLQLLPLAVGMSLRIRLGERGKQLAATLRRVGSLLLALVVITLLVTRGSFLLVMGASAFVSMWVLVVLSLVAGAITTAPRLPDSLLACVRNLTLALMVAEVAEPGGASTLVVAAYGLVMYVVASLCLLMRRRVPSGLQELP